ncbi:hypothetical protein FIBSPDRAFT_873745 [Athelia psychrophila]|uniref:Uncharacterized protein n=1 Tax=Athelia psychrophila TaxID=1759441 RepID=A0A165Y6M6_9AGAM|nr:hypothetical protein FIBSPDRAFT_873745 [Fibularhizoctonia sp. CBS 109695]
MVLRLAFFDFSARQLCLGSGAGGDTSKIPASAPVHRSSTVHCDLPRLHPPLLLIRPSAHQWPERGVYRSP